VNAEADRARSRQALYQRYRRAVAGERLPVALVDLEALEVNTARLAATVRAAGKTLRLATKSVRCPALIDHIRQWAGDVARGLMAYAVAEAAYLVECGESDLLVAYPTVQPADLDTLVALNRRPGVRVALVVDSAEQVERIAERAGAAGGEVPLVIEVDLSLRALGGRVHLGVQRSPLRRAAEVADLAARIRDRAGVRFTGVMGYEAQVAGLGERNPFTRAMNPIKAAIKRASIPHVARLRAEVAAALADRGIELELFNGGGTGSLRHTGDESAVTEVTAGSGFLCSHLFDYYADLELEPAAFFALQVTRVPGPGVVTCHGGGFVASGEAGPDRLPRPWLPAGLSLTRFEGAGEVQTPVTGPGTAALGLGDPVFFRHAKAGELAEHTAAYLLVRGDRVVDRAPTYRGLGKTFL
jgi:D-serine deaminase-like pyridoxal phosphate-dependent protein